MVSFGDAEELVAMAKDAGVPTIWQIQRLSQAEQAMNAGVDVVVAQGQEGGGHGMDRGLMSLLPAVRDLVGSQTIVLAAGGIADGRGLAASLMLGADGVMLGTRFWASIEAQGSDVAKAAIVDAKGDNTVRSKVFMSCAALTGLGTIPAASSETRCSISGTRASKTSRNTLRPPRLPTTPRMLMTCQPAF